MFMLREVSGALAGLISKATGLSCRKRKPAPSRLPQAPACLAPPLLSCLESEACYNPIIHCSPSLCCATSRSFVRAGETDAMRPMHILHPFPLHKVCLLRIHGVHCLGLEKVSQCSLLW